MVLRCIADRFVFKSPDSDWAILVAKDEAGAETSLVGGLSDVQIGEHLEAVGEWEETARYGTRFRVSSHETTRPRSMEGMKAYLVGHMHGVGPSMAGRIVAHFGEETLSIIDDDPSRLLEVPGFGASKLESALEAWEEKTATRDVILRLQEYGASPNRAKRIYRAWGERTLAMLEANPYQLTEIDRIGFVIANDIAMGMGIAINDPRRIDAGILHVLDQAAKKDGHTFLKLAEVFEQARTTLRIDERPEIISDRVKRLAEAGRLVLEPSAYGDRHVYLPTYWKKEVGLAMKFRSLSEQVGLFPVPESPEHKEGDIVLTDRQWQAIQTGLGARISILTGGPGSGKCLNSRENICINDDLVKIGNAWDRWATATVFDGEGYWSEPSEPLFVPSLQADGSIARARVTRLYRQRVHEMGRRVTAQDGSSITMTSAHRLHGIDDWQREIRVGDHVCVPRRIPHGTRALHPSLVELLAWQISEGHESTPQRSATITQGEAHLPVLHHIQNLVRDVETALGIRMNSANISQHADRNVYYLRIISVAWYRWLTEQGYEWGHKSAGKRLPPFVMQGDAMSTRLLLRTLLAAEGSVDCKKGVLEFPSASEHLVEQVRILLRRFGVWMRIRKTMKAASNGSGIKRPYWIGEVSGTSLRILAERVGIADEKKQTRLVQVCEKVSNTSMETIPAADILAEAKAATGLSRNFFGVTSEYFSTKQPGRATATRAVAMMRAMADGTAEETYRQSIEALTGRGGHRYKAHNLARFEQMPARRVTECAGRLEERLAREVFYTTVTEVEPVWLDEWVYDLEVEGTHNYVAGGFLSHNTASCKALCDTIDGLGLKIQLCAPTGKAAKRIAEATGHQAATIHRLLEWQPFGGFARNAQNPLDADVVVVDEASMLDLPLADSFFQAIGEKTHVVMVGDIDQLPSIGVGRVLDDVMRSKRVPITVLDVVFRQAKRSMIIQAAYAINSGRVPDDDPDVAQAKLGAEDEVIHDYFYINRSDNSDILRLTVEYATERIPNRNGFDPRNDIQVIAPQKNTVVGVDALNHALQARINPDGIPISDKRGYRIGDKLLNTQNNYTHDVMNGEFAVIRGYNAADRLVELELDDRIVEMGIDDVESSFLLAYATTVHKMQGSSAKAVVLPMSTSYSHMLSRHLLYTAVTRAEEMCVVIGSNQAMGAAVSDARARPRNSALAERLIHPSMSGQLL